MSDFFLKNILSIIAYIDPGSGSMIIQVVIATVLGGIVAVKIFWQNIVLFFKRLFNKNND